jgi:1,4-dihydroxy-2-naphthoate polyprenyltransferase
MESLNTKAWVSAFRLRTLPLALSSIAMGSFLAASAGKFHFEVFALAALTTILLQILSNLANDYGDTVNGADNVHREGPSRAVQSGAITINSMKKAIGLFVVLCLLSGISLLYVSVGFNLDVFLFFLVLGVLSIMAAISYTSGKRPYGYAGLGDVSVFIFFGLVGVLGTYFLHANSLHSDIIFPAISCGFFATAVLNVNNIRDIQSDALAGKKSIPVRIGREKAVLYHWFLLITGWVSILLYTALNFNSPYQFLFVITLPLFIKNGKAIASKSQAMLLDPYLKQMAISTLLFVITFGLGKIIG